MGNPSSSKFRFVKTVTDGSSLPVCDLLAVHTGLSKTCLKDAMNKGALWLSRKGQGRIRLRKATFRLQKGDALELNYDPNVLSLEPPTAFCLKDFDAYSIWFKPANLLTQGTEFGDHASLLRQVELFFTPRRQVFPVHRLDREVSGLIMVAHTRQAAGLLSGLFQKHEVIKRYRAEVLGLPAHEQGVIQNSLDGKEARTRYRVLTRQPDANTALLEVEIETGRLHQIRRHLANIGHPVMGDPRYGKGNKDGNPLRLVACGLQWVCPFSHGLEKLESVI